MSVTWEDPPPAQGAGTRGKWVPILLSLQERPGVWARIITTTSGNTASSTASNLKKGIVKVPPGRYEFTSRSVPEGGAVYARYIGEAEA